MNNLYLAVSVVFPLFCMMSLGYLLKSIRVFNDSFLRQLNALCFKVFLPMVLFINIYRSDFNNLFSGRLILFAIGVVIASFLLLTIIVPLIEKENANRGVVIQGVFRSNFILFGIPIAASLYGSENTGTTAILTAFVIPLFNLLATITLSAFAEEKQSICKVSKDIMKNPLIIGSIVAFFFVLTGIRMPMIVENTIYDISKVATPLALIVLGGSFEFRSLGKYKKLLSISLLGKLIILPGIFIPISIAFGFRGMELAALMAMMASPTAVSSFTMAQSAKANYELAGQIVVLDSIVSVLTIFIWITGLMTLGVI